MPIVYRPSDYLWRLTKILSVAQWDLFGCFSTEKRCLATYGFLKEKGLLRSSYFAYIRDKDSPYSDEIKDRLTLRQAEFLRLGGSLESIHEYELFCRLSDTVSAAKLFASLSNGNLILDISSLPKRFFFPLVKIFLRDPRLENLVVTYTSPESYTEGDLAEDFEDWKPLPMFGEPFPPKEHRVFIVGAGHMSMGLPDHITSYIRSTSDLRVLFPFPGDPRSVRRAWWFVHEVARNLPQNTVKINRVSAHDVSGAFDQLVADTDNGQKSAFLAPYGPKPISLAMCIFSILTENPVYYTQPRVYLPDYSLGISRVEGNPRIHSYCIRFQGNCLYHL